jgi:hypothetical protein
MSSHHDIENLLRQMPLAKPSADLDKRVMDTLAGGAADSSAAVSSAAGTETRRAVALRQPRARRAWLIGAVGGALAAAAVVMLVVGLPPNTTTVTPPPPTALVKAAGAPAPLPVEAAPVQPVRLEQNYSELSDEGIVFPDPQTPMQTFRHRTVDRVQFFDPQRNIRMETTVPREEFIFVKAPMQ